MALDVEAIKARHAATSAGPWDIDKEGFCIYSPDGDDDCFDNSYLVAELSDRNDDLIEPDLLFIAHAHADIPALVAEVERLTAMVEAQQDIIREMSEQTIGLLGLLGKTEEATGEEDVRVFGADAWVYCRQHCKPHQTGWCGVGVHDKIALGVDNAKDALQKCRDWGFDLYQDRPL